MTTRNLLIGLGIAAALAAGVGAFGFTASAQDGPGYGPMMDGYGPGYGPGYGHMRGYGPGYGPMHGYGRGYGHRRGDWSDDSQGEGYGPRNHLRLGRQ
jgi:hypothetical protein